MISQILPCTAAFYLHADDDTMMQRLRHRAETSERIDVNEVLLVNDAVVLAKAQFETACIEPIEKFLLNEKSKEYRTLESFARVFTQVRTSLLGPMNFVICPSHVVQLIKLDNDSNSLEVSNRELFKLLCFDYVCAFRSRKLFD